MLAPTRARTPPYKCAHTRTHTASQAYCMRTHTASQACRTRMHTTSQVCRTPVLFTPLSRLFVCSLHADLNIRLHANVRSRVLSRLRTRLVNTRVVDALVCTPGIEFYFKYTPGLHACVRQAPTRARARPTCFSPYITSVKSGPNGSFVTERVSLPHDSFYCRSLDERQVLCLELRV